MTDEQVDNQDMNGASTPKAPERVTAFKGFNEDLTCRGFQFAEGATFEHEGRVSLCNSGFHAVLAPLDVFSYYPPATSVYRTVDLEDVAPQREGDSKVAASNTGDYSAASNTGYGSAASNTGDYSAASNTGTRSAASNTGDYSAASNTGYGSAASNTGTRSAASNTGDYSAARVDGKESVAIVTGFDGRAAGGESCWIVLTERDADWHILEVKAVQVGTKPNGKTGLKVESGIYYQLRDGKVVRAENQAAQA